MNKEKTLEQLEIAKQIISDGLEWESNTSQYGWIKGIGDPISCIFHKTEIRIKPQPDKFAELKKAHAEGKTIQCKYIDTEEYLDLEFPKWDSAVEYYRIKPEPDKCEELKKAHKEGKEIQYYDTFEKKWFTTASPSFVHGDFRLKPEPVKVPLGPDDVPPGSVFRIIIPNGKENYTKWTHPVAMTVSGPVLSMTNISTYVLWTTIQQDYEINRSIPLTGKWNHEAWEPCYKDVDQ